MSHCGGIKPYSPLQHSTTSDAGIRSDALSNRLNAVSVSDIFSNSEIEMES